MMYPATKVFMLNSVISMSLLAGDSRMLSQALASLATGEPTLRGPTISAMSPCPSSRIASCSSVTCWRR